MYSDAISDSEDTAAAVVGPPAPHHDVPQHHCPKSANKHGAPTELANTAFRIEEKRYKLVRQDKREKKRIRLDETDFTDVVDFHHLEKNTLANQKMMREAPASDGVRCHTFAGVPGLLFFPNVIDEASQRYWAGQALHSYSDSSQYRNNITALDPQAVTSIYAPPMRWATLGFQYQWTERVYEKSKYSSFPKDLDALMSRLVRAVAEVRQDQFEVCGSYQSQTAIVNYFPVGSMMMAHQDISEVCLDKPLMSLSLGCTAIFLMGSDKREDKPYAFYLRSGDVVAFTGPSRTAYHAVPRVLDDCPAHFLVRHHDGDVEGKEEEDSAAASCLQKMRGLRVNINVRQVYDEDCSAILFGREEK